MKTNQSDLFFDDIKSLISALTEVGYVLSPLEEICIKLEPTSQEGIYRLRRMQCECCECRDECDLPQFVPYMSNEHTDIQSPPDIYVSKSLYSCIQQRLRKVWRWLQILALLVFCKASSNGDNNHHPCGR